MLIAALDDKDIDVRKAAVRSLGQIDDYRAVSPIFTIFRNLRDESDPDFRLEAGNTLYVMRDPRSVDPLITELKLDNMYTASMAARFLGRFHEPRAADALSYAATRSSLRDTQIYAAASLGSMGDARAVEPLISALNEKTIGYRSLSAQVLGMLKDARAVPPLIMALKDSSDIVRERAVASLGQIRDPRAIIPLISHFTDDESGRGIVIQEFIHEALQSIGPAAVPDLITALSNKNIVVRRKAVQTLGMIKDRRAIEPLIVILEDKDVTVRYWAVWALAKYNDASTVGPFIDILKQPQPPSCRDPKLEAQRVEYPWGVVGKRLLLNFGSPVDCVSLRVLIVNTLGRSNDPRAKKVLIEMLNDEEQWVRAAAARYVTPFKK